MEFKLIVLATAIVPLLTFCSESDFAAGSKKQQATQTRTGGGDENPEVSPNNGETNPSGEGVETSLDTGSGGIDGCALGTMIEDPNAMATFTGYDARDQINALPDGYTKIPTAKSYAGAFHFDQPTADAVCKLLGYVASSSITESKFSSCGNNAIATWVESSKDFSVQNACKDNSKIKQVVCKGKLKDPCIKEKSWIFK